MTANDDIEDKAANVDTDMDGNGGVQSESEMEAEIAELAANADRHPSKRNRRKPRKPDGKKPEGREGSSEEAKPKPKARPKDGQNAKPAFPRRKVKPDKVKMMKTADIKAVIAIIVVAVLMVIAAVGGSIAYVAANAGKTTVPASSTGMKPNAASVPSDPTKSGTEWLAKYFDEVAAKFPADTFTEGNQNLEKLMSGDDSIIPDSISGKIIKGTNKTGMTIGRDVLNSASYIGLIMFSNAYEKTKSAGTQLSGSALSSYDGNTNIVFIPVQSLVVSDQNILFELKWDGKDWKLVGDSLGWQTYVMLQKLAQAASNQNGNGSASNSNK